MCSALRRRRVAVGADPASALRNLATLVRLPCKTQAVALEAALFLLMARLFVDHVPMPRLRRWIDIETGAAPTVERRANGSARVGRIVRKVAP
ncbi:MAG: hypothetical protein OXG51_06600, partial [Gammaproteobacteria bacterium]|nr:hypothetical protein [Gammaproteobacteria bacterium]